jgi:hypothetical protein
MIFLLQFVIIPLLVPANILERSLSVSFATMAIWLIPIVAVSLIAMILNDDSFGHWALSYIVYFLSVFIYYLVCTAKDFKVMYLYGVPSAFLISVDKILGVALSTLIVQFIVWCCVKLGKSRI